MRRRSRVLKRLSGCTDHQAADMDDDGRDFHLESAWEEEEKERERERTYIAQHIKRWRTRL